MLKTEQKALSARQVADQYSICLGSLANMRSQKRGPKFFKINRRVVYRPQDIESWLFGNPVLTTDSMPEAA